MNLLKVSIWSLIIITINIFVGIINQKFYAIYTGSEGILAIGNFNNLSSIVYIVASGGIYGGIVKLVASDNETNFNDLLKIIYSILFFYSILTSIILTLFNSTIFNTFFKHLGVSNFSIFLFNICLSFVIFSNGALYVLNGKNQIDKYSIINIIIQIFNLAVTIIFVKFFLINGAILSLYIPNLIGFILILILAKEYFTWPTINIFKILKSKIYKKLLFFSIVSILGIILLSVSQLFTRDIIIDYITVKEAGSWQIINNFSKMWMSIIISILSVYFYPKIASVCDNIIIKNEIINLLRIGLPVIFLSFLLIYLVKDYLINTVYSQSFVEASNYFIYQLIGDFIKVISLVFGYVFLAKEKLKIYALTEIFFFINYIVLSYLLIKLYDLEGVFIAHILSYVIYLLIQLIFFYKSFN